MMWIIALCCVVGLARSASAQPAGPPPSNPNKDVPVQITWDQKIPMRDGLRLSAFAQNGHVFVATDARGRGNSDDKLVPGQVEARDGHDLAEWLARQPWCDGQVATWGGSWLGCTQWTIRGTCRRGIRPTTARRS